MKRHYFSRLRRALDINHRKVFQQSSFPAVHLCQTCNVMRTSKPSHVKLLRLTGLSLPGLKGRYYQCPGLEHMSKLLSVITLFGFAVCASHGPDAWLVCIHSATCFQASCRMDIACLNWAVSEKCFFFPCGLHLPSQQCGLN